MPIYERNVRAEDNAHVSGDPGVPVLAVRNDAGGPLAGTTGDYIPFTTDATGALRVNATSVGGTFTTDFSYAEDSAHVSGQVGAFTLGVRNDANAVLTSANGDYSPFSVTSTGALNIADAGGSITVDGTVTVIGSHTFTDAYANPTDDVDVIALTGGFNGTTWDRIRSAGNNVDAVVPTTLGVLTIDNYNYGYNGTNWDRLRAFGDNADGEIVATLGDLQTKDRIYGFNGTTWDRQRSTGDNADAVATATLGEAIVIDRNTVFNGTTWDRWRSAPGATGAGSVGGPTAADGALVVAPVTIGARASNAAPTEVSADGDVVNSWSTRSGRIRVYTSGRRRLGVYNVTFTSTTTAAADAATAGRGWLVNNTGSTVFGALRRVGFTGTTTTGLLTPTAPIFQVERMTFTGTPTGAQLTPCKRDSTDGTNTLTWRTANTGMTITAGAALTGFQMGGSLLATNMMTPMQYWPIFGDEDQYIILRAGEGIVIRQATGGTVADTRQANFDVAWEEFNSTDFVIRD